MRVNNVDVQTASKVVAITIGGAAFDRCRAIQADIADTITFVDTTGTSVANFPVFPGPNPVQTTDVTAATGAVKLWALY